MLAIKGSGGRLFWPGSENPLVAWAIRTLDDTPISFEYMQPRVRTLLDDCKELEESYFNILP